MKSWNSSVPHSSPEIHENVWSLVGVAVQYVWQCFYEDVVKIESERHRENVLEAAHASQMWMPLTGLNCWVWWFQSSLHHMSYNTGPWPVLSHTHTHTHTYTHTHRGIKCSTGCTKTHIWLLRTYIWPWNLFEELFTMQWLSQTRRCIC